MPAFGPRLPCLLASLALGLGVNGVPGVSAAWAGEIEPGFAGLLGRSEGRARVLTWQRMLEAGRSGSDEEKLEQVNRHFNTLGFASDAEQWGRQDYWATPMEFLYRGAGDCEDFAVAKYISLRQLGVSIERLRLVYAFAAKRNEAHMVLAYFEAPQADPLILDNLVSDIRPASRRRDLSPVYSFNDSGLWLTRKDGKSYRVGNSSRLAAWRELKERIREAPAAIQ